ncbi:MAG: hypothetical protein ACRD5G_17200 [Candidatus Acidiferrales bacterium]
MATGSGRSTTASYTLNSAVLAPNPSARESAATTVWLGLLRSMRMP